MLIVVGASGVPKIVSQCIAALEKSLHVEGIFRLSGEQKSVEMLRRKLDLSLPVDLNKADPHSIAGLPQL